MNDPTTLKEKEMDKDFTASTPVLIAYLDGSRSLMVSFLNDTVRIGAYTKDQQRLNLDLTAETLYGMAVDFNAPDPDAQRDDQKTEAALATD